MKKIIQFDIQIERKKSKHERFAEIPLNLDKYNIAGFKR